MIDDMKDKKSVKILFVCLGNICRSPAAEGVMKKLLSDLGVDFINVDSCGIGNWHVGHGPDERISDAARSRGVVLTSIAKQFQKEFFEQFDLILASDHEVLKHLYHLGISPEHKTKLFLMTEFSSRFHGQEVPDPYYQPEAAFDLVLDMLEDSCEGLFRHIQSLRTIT